MANNFNVVSVTPGGIWIADTDLDGNRSVTNDAERVVKLLLEKYGPRPIHYRDTDGRWDTLDHNGKEFTGFVAGAPPVPDPGF